MREAVRDAFILVTGAPADFLFSGWGGTLTETELAVVEDRIPEKSELMAKAVQAFNDVYGDAWEEAAGPADAASNGDADRVATEAGIRAAFKVFGLDI